MKKPVVISFFNNKGGTGKSTNAVNLGSILANDYKVLVIDNDPQGNATENLSQEQTGAIAKAYTGEVIEIKKVEFEPILKELESTKKVQKELYLLAGGEELLDIESSISGLPARESTLARNLKDKIKDFDFVLIDNPPSKSVFVWNALYFSDHVIIPFKPGKNELSGVDKLLSMLTTMDEKLKHEVNILGILITMDTYTALCNHYCSLIAEKFPEDKIFDESIPASVQYMKAISAGVPIDVFLGKSDPVVKAYINLKNEILKKLNGGK